MRGINEKFLNGASLSDTELAKLLKFYENLSDKIDCLDNSFTLFRKEIQSRLDTLNGYKYARKVN